MKLMITTDSNNILSDSGKSNLSSFTEYGMNFSNIKSHKITENFNFALKKKADSNVIAVVANKILLDTNYEEAEKK